MRMALRTTYISCVARLFGLMAERFFLCLSPTDFRWTRARTNCLHRIRSRLFANIFNPLSPVNLLLLVLLIMRLAHISGSGRDRTQSACEWRQSDSGRVYWTCVYEQEEDAFEWPSLGVEFDVDPRVTVSFQGHHFGTSHVVIGELFAAGVNAICLVCQSLAAVHFVLELDVGQLVFQLNCVWAFHHLWSWCKGLFEYEFVVNGLGGKNAVVRQDLMVESDAILGTVNIV